MITAYSIQNTMLQPQKLARGEPLPAHTVWIDILHPTQEEDQQVEHLTGISIPTREDMKEIEDSSRFYAENDAQYFTVPLLHSSEGVKPGINPVTFILTGDLLITVRYVEPKAILFFQNRVTKPGNELVKGGCDGRSVMLGLLESVTDRVADLLEGVAAHLDHESDLLFADNTNPMSTPRFRSAMRLLGNEGSFLSKVSECLSGLSRLISYMHTDPTAAGKKSVVKSRLLLIERDIQSLRTHSDFLSGKITFLLDTVVGLVSVEQNAIIKFFSVASVGFMPPTLVASIYGMNFKFMPELDWPHGYPFAIILMLASAILPLVYFRYKKWL